MDSGSPEDDLLIKSVHNEYENMFNLKDLTFTGYKYDQNDQNIFSILRFDRSKISIEQADSNTLKILFDNKPFLVSIKAFCTLMKKDKGLAANKHIKVKNLLASLKLGDIFFLY